MGVVFTHSPVDRCVVFTHSLRIAADRPRAEDAAQTGNQGERFMADETMVEVEIKGVKMMVDTRHAKRIEEIRVGSRVAVLKKTYSGWDTFNGIVVGFANFETLPTIIIAHIRNGYRETKIEFTNYNAESKDVQIAIVHDDDLKVDKAGVCEAFETERRKLRNQIEELDAQERYFLEHFAAWWTHSHVPKPESLNV